MQDGDGRRTQILASPLSQTYNLNARGLVDSVTESGDSARTRAYGYDGAMRLKQAAYKTGKAFSEAYTYDPAGNRLTKRNGTEDVISAFDLKAGTQTPANNLLRGLVFPTNPQASWRYQYTASGDVTQIQVVTPAILTAFPSLEFTHCNTLDSRRRLTKVQFVGRVRAAVGGAIPTPACQDTAKMTTLADTGTTRSVVACTASSLAQRSIFSLGPRANCSLRSRLRATSRGHTLAGRRAVHNDAAGAGPRPLFSQRQDG